MNELLVKYKDANDTSEFGYILANTYNGRVADLIPIVKQVDSIQLEEKWYKYVSCEFVPSSDIGILDVLYIYVDGYDKD